MTVGKCRILDNLNRRMRAILCDCRTFVGTMVAYDKYMNLVLTDCVEYKSYRPKKSKERVVEKRNLGFIILRGENIVSLILEESPIEEMSGSSESSEFHSSSPSAVRSCSHSERSRDLPKALH